MTHAVPPGPGLMRRCVVAMAIAVAVSGCATSSNPKDPFEKFNRAMFSFNDTLDQVAVKPVATAYKNVVPSVLQRGVGNFFGNLTDAWSAINNLLQGKGQDGMSDLTRFALNSTLGMGGLFDLASEAGIRKHSEDFGQTLGVWGVAPGPYLMLPLFGPSTVRDTLAMPLDLKGDLWTYKDPVNVRTIGTVVSLVDQRAALLDASNLMEEAALDRYEFVRDSYLQRRDSKVFDGESPRKYRINIGRNTADDRGEDKPASSEAPAKELTVQAGVDTVDTSQAKK